MNKFAEIPFKLNTLDLFYIRTSIFAALKENLQIFHGKLLDFGCGQMPYKEFILKNTLVREYLGLDINKALKYDKTTKPDFYWDGKSIPLDDNSFDCILATEVLEHCPNPELTLREIYRVLKAEGILFFTVPYLWPLHEVPNDEYRYTSFSLQRHLGSTGFNNIEIKSLGGWNASLAQMLGLWARRSEISTSKYKRRIFSFILKPIIKYLIKHDNKNDIFKEGMMITGFYGTAQK